MGKADITRQYIIERTAPIFNRKGYAGTSMSDLTTATGLTKGSIYGNFKNKDEVALEAFHYNLETIINSFAVDVQGVKGSVNRLLAYVEVYKKHFKHIQEHGGCPILNTAIHTENTHIELQNAAKDAFKKWREGIEKIILDGKKTGEIKEEADPRYYSGLFFSLIDGSMLVARLTGELKVFNTNMDYMAEIIKQELAV